MHALIKGGISSSFINVVPGESAIDEEALSFTKQDGLAALSDMNKAMAVLRKQIHGAMSFGSNKMLTDVVKSIRAETVQMKCRSAALRMASLPQQSHSRRSASSPAERHGRNNAVFIGDDGREEFAHVRLISKAENNKKRKATSNAVVEGDSISDNDEENVYVIDDDQSPSKEAHDVNDIVMDTLMIEENSPAKKPARVILVMENSPPSKKKVMSKPPAIKKGKTGGTKHKASHKKPMDCIRTTHIPQHLIADV
jgi:hypothetical protein